MYRTDNPLHDFNVHDADMQSRLRRRPKCSRCGEHIQKERAVCYDGNWYCDECEKDLWEEIRKYYVEDVDQ